MNHRTTNKAKILNGSPEFLEVTQGMAPEEAFDFWMGFLFTIDTFPDQTYESFLPIWQRWKEQDARGQVG